MINAMQLKAAVKKVAAEKKISSQLALQNYMMERLLVRISFSRFRDHLVFKGGFLISAMVGLGSRATMDMDASIKNYPFSKETVLGMFGEIVKIDCHDGIRFEIREVLDIRESDPYQGFRLSLFALFPPLAVPLKVDLTTGDPITPNDVVFNYPLMFEKKTVSVLAYNLETILAEKLETVLSRGTANTRLRDFYDVYILTKCHSQSLNQNSLRAGLWATTSKRGTETILKDYQKTVEIIRHDSTMLERWKAFSSTASYGRNLSFEDVLICVREILDNLFAK